MYLICVCLNPKTVAFGCIYNSASLSLTPGGEKAETEQADKDEAMVDVSRLDLRVGRIITTQQLPETDGVYVQQVDVGEAAPRTVVGELARHIPVDQVQYYSYIMICVVMEFLEYHVIFIWTYYSFNLRLN